MLQAPISAQPWWLSRHSCPALQVETCHLGLLAPAGHMVLRVASSRPCGLICRQSHEPVAAHDVGRL